MCESPDPVMPSDVTPLRKSIDTLKVTYEDLKSELTDLKDDKHISEIKIKEQAQ